MKRLAPPEQQAGQQDEDTPSIGSPARNLRPRPLCWINGRPIYNEDKQVPGTHFILRQLAASDNWGASLIGVVRKADEDNSSVDTNDSEADKAYDSDWKPVQEKVEDVYLSNGIINMMDFTPTTLTDPQYELGPGVRERLPERFNHCWAIATHDSPERHLGRIGVAIYYSLTKVRIIFSNGNTAKVPLTTVRAARPNWSDCARCTGENLYIINDENLSNFSTIGRRVWKLVSTGSSKIELEFKDGHRSTYHPSEVTKIKDGWHLTSYPVATIPPRGNGHVIVPHPLPTIGYVNRNYLGFSCGHHNGEADPPYPII